MVSQLDERTFIEEAKAKGASDDAIVLMLEELGWGTKQAKRALARSYLATYTGLESVARTRQTAVGLDIFLHALSGALIISWTIGALILIDMFVTNLFPNARDWYFGDSGYGAALILVATPIYYLMVVSINRRIASGSLEWNSLPRQIASGVLLFIGGLTIFFYLVSFISDFLTGFQSQGATVVKVSCSIGLLLGLMAYYFHWLKPPKSLSQTDEPES